MTRLFAVLVILLGVSACEYSSKTRVSAAPGAPAAAPASAEVKDSLGGIGRQPSSW